MSQSPSLIKNIYYGLQNYQSKQLLFLLLVGPLLDSLLFYRQTQITFRRSEIISQNNQPQYLSNYYTVFGISIIQVIINLLFNNWFKKFIIQDLKKFYQQFYLEKILLQTNPFWLSTQNTQELYQSFQTGSETLVNTFIFSIDTLKSLLNIGLSFSLIWNELGSQNIIPIICIFWMICYQFVHPGKEIPWYSESIFSSLAKTKPSKDQYLKTNPPKVSIQSFQIIHAEHSFRCSLM